MPARAHRRAARALLAPPADPEIGLEGQLKLLDAKVLLLGAGGLGSPTALYLAAAGVGTLGIVDDDVVDLSNLQRQVAHSKDRIGMPKVDSAEIAIKEINPDVNVVKYPMRLDADNIMEIIEGYDVIVDGLDNFPTRYLLNDATVRLQIPVVSASILGFDGPAVGLPPLRGPVLPLPLPDAAAGRARSVLRRQRRARRAAGRDGRCSRRSRSIKLVTGAGEPLAGRLLLYEALGTTFTELKVRRDPDCPICSRDPSEISDEEMGVFPDYEAFCAARWLACRASCATDQDPAGPPALHRRARRRYSADGATSARSCARSPPSTRPPRASCSPRTAS